MADAYDGQTTSTQVAALSDKSVPEVRDAEALYSSSDTQT